jgi:Cof subfamily protein (haloacid dehalogenase superfamily)
MKLPDFIKVPDAVAIDLDGTLLSSKSQLSGRNRKAIERCVSCGVPVVIATSRPARSVRRLIGDRLTERCSLVLLNGAIAIGTPSLSGYYREILPDEISRGIVDYTLKTEPRATIGIEIDGYKFGANWNIPPSLLWELNSATPDMLLSLEESLELKHSKITIGGVGDRMLDLAENLKKKYGDSVSIVHSFYATAMIMITTIQSTKTNALRKLLGSINASLENVVAIGDDNPDLIMLRECGISIAVANAVPEIKAVSNYQTASNDDDGVAIILEQIIDIINK